MTDHFLNLHVLQPFSFANPNRDDVGSPKSLFYGGVQRSRISSQAWKRAVRLETERRLNGEHASDQKTFRAAPKHLAGPLSAKTLSLLDPAADPTSVWKAAFCATQVLTTKEVNIKDAHAAWKKAHGDTPATPEDEEDSKGSTLVWLTADELDDIAALLAADWKELGPLCADSKGTAAPDRIKALLDSAAIKPARVTIAAFGRMFAKDPRRNVEAAVQVAHAFTTHEAVQQVDYFTAVDDLTPTQGAGHLNLAQFTGGVYYRYFSFDLGQLEQNLGRRESLWLEELLRASIHALPSGKQNSTANHEAPALVFAELRDRPVSYAAAFETPVPSVDGTAASARALLAHAALVDQMLGAPGGPRALVTLVEDAGPLPEGVSKVAALNDLIAAVAPWN